MSRLVYKLSNMTKREIYYGTTKQELLNRVWDHIMQKTEAIKHWDWHHEKVIPEIVEEELSDQEAVSLAHQLEEHTPPEGWEIIQTGGM